MASTTAFRPARGTNDLVSLKHVHKKTHEWPHTTPIPEPTFKPTREPTSAPTAEPTAAAPNTDVGGPAAAACLALDCPASALPVALDIVSFRRAATATTRWKRKATASSSFAPCPPAHRSRPRFLPQGGDDTDSCKKDGVYYEGVYGDCEVGLP